MDYFLFWNKVLAKRAVDLIKQSPVIFVGMMVIISAFIIGRQNINIEVNIGSAIILLIIFAILSIIASLKNYYTIPVLIAYSKSNLQNRDIKIRFFIKQAFMNNLLLIFFDIIMFTKFVEIDYYAMIPLIIGSIASLVFSFFIMYLKHGYMNKKIYKIAGKKSGISPVIKSTFYDYVTPEFFMVIVFCYALFGAIIFDIGETENPLLILSVLTAILSVGMMSVNETIYHINWKFFSIIYPQHIFSHIKKTVLFMVGVLGLLFIAFIVIALQMGILLLVKYLYSIVVLLLFSVYNAFTRSNSIIKGIRSILFIVLVIWVGTLHSAFLFLPIIPLLIIALLAKDDFKEWYLQ